MEIMCEKFICGLGGKCLYETQCNCNLTVNTCHRPELLNCEKCMLYKWCRAQINYKYKKGRMKNV